jgi:hypothetical protein
MQYFVQKMKALVPQVNVRGRQFRTVVCEASWSQRTWDLLGKMGRRTNVGHA